MDRMKHYFVVTPGFIPSVISIGPGLMSQWVQKTFFHGTNFSSLLEGYWVLLPCRLWLAKEHLCKLYRWNLGMKGQPSQPSEKDLKGEANLRNSAWKGAQLDQSLCAPRVSATRPPLQRVWEEIFIPDCKMNCKTELDIAIACLQERCHPNPSFLRVKPVFYMVIHW